MKKEYALKKRKNPIYKNKKKLFFYLLLMVIPVAHFLVFYVYINFNSFVLAFSNYTRADEGFLVKSFAGFSNFKQGFQELFKYPYRIKNSLLFTAGNIFLVTPLTLLFSFYIYKKGPCSGFFRVVLYIPQILSEVVIGLIFIKLCNSVIPTFANEVFGMENVMGYLENPDTSLYFVFFFNSLFWFGVNMLLYSNTMSAINESIIESCHLDGANRIQEFWYIVLPMIYPTLVTMIVVMVSSTFTEQFRMYTLFSNRGDSIGNIGYFLYLQVQKSDVWVPAGTTKVPYTVLSAIGLMLTAVVLPTTLIVKKLVTKYGPRED